MTEIWKDVVGYEGLYQVSSLGRVKSLPRFGTVGGIMCGFVRPDGYRHITLHKNNNAKSYLVHRIVATSFIENHNNLPEVNHINGNKLDNCVENLEWCSRKDNLYHAFSHSLRKHCSPRKVLCVETGKIYESTEAAEKDTTAWQQNIVKVCQGKRNTAGGYHWRYA